MLGFPIRKSSDQRSVDSSPRHIAASHVLHRLSMPRHPPCALYNLQTQKPRIKITQNEHAPRGQRVHLDARNHYPILKHHTPPSRWGDSTRLSRVLSQDPTVCLAVRLIVVHPVPAHYRREPLTACAPPIGTLSWCSLERR